MITYERFEEIFNTTDSKWTGDNTFAGLLIISKYIDFKTKTIIEAAEHDIIYSSEINDLIEAGITEEDVISLAKLNWSFNKEYDCLSCFV
jgi:hypothetical protein